MGPQRFTWRGFNTHLLLIGGTVDVGTPHEIAKNRGGWVAVGGAWVVLSGNITTLWLHLASWNLPDSQLG